jgi:HMG (high mobility group) box
MSNHLRSPGKKSKVPRPPNAFILYRKKHHPQLKAANPDMHNNEISVILGKQWNNESDSVKTTYRHMAEKIKRKHAEDNPGYQYAPRKPSEKKRRMTARKLAAQRADAVEQDLQFFPVSDMVEVADHERSTSEGVTTADENEFTSTDDIFKTSSISLTHAAAWTADSGRSPSADLLRIDDDTLDVSLTMPAPQQPLQQQVGTHYDGVNGLLPFDPRWLSTAPALPSTNEQDFLNSLIDWEGIQQDVNTIRESTAEERDDLIAAETGTSRLLSSLLTQLSPSTVQDQRID